MIQRDSNEVQTCQASITGTINGDKTSKNTEAQLPSEFIQTTARDNDYSLHMAAEDQYMLGYLNTT